VACCVGPRARRNGAQSAPIKPRGNDDENSREIDTADDDSAEVSERIYDAFDDWILSPGDTIKIEEIN
jgi:hypothetical protein